jgi:predicted enzyme related to lactoylglutathione lyase
MIAPESSGIGGHLSTTLGHEPHNYTVFYVDVENLAACIKEAESLGGKTLVPPVEIPTGTFACKTQRATPSGSGKADL